MSTLTLTQCDTPLKNPAWLHPCEVINFRLVILCRASGVSLELLTAVIVSIEFQLVCPVSGRLHIEDEIHIVLDCPNFSSSGDDFFLIK